MSNVRLDLSNRLEHLERENRRVKLFGAAVLTGLTAAAVVGQAMATMGVTDQPVQSRPLPPQEIPRAWGRFVGPTADRGIDGSSDLVRLWFEAPDGTIR
jgi:hypothetical protein